MSFYELASDDLTLKDNKESQQPSQVPLEESQEAQIYTVRVKEYK